MSYLKRFFQFIFSRQMLAFIAIVLLGVAVWFVGPLLAFGGLHPLASVPMRVTVIVMLLALLLFWWVKWPASVIGVAALCLLFWHAAPLLAVGEMHPFEPVWVRVLAISIVVFCYAVYGLYRLWQAVRSNDALLKRILYPSTDKSTGSIARDEIREVSNVVAKAMQQLKRMRSSSVGVRRLFESKRYLYELPWYMVIGTPGAGKTTAILNSGLQFPLAEQMGAVSVQGEGGTSNCDWWFTNEAVLIDTAGRYTEQNEQNDSNVADANAAEWQGFLGLLRKYRPRAPINGAVLTISVADLLSRSAAERTAMAAAMRARLGELRQHLGIRFPVYVAVTKLDLLPGFAEYFQSLTAEGRTQVWGFTLPYEEDFTRVNAESLRQRCVTELQLLERRLEAGMDNRLQEEYENDRRKKLYALPQEFRSLARLVTATVDLIFLDSRYDDTQLHSNLRGVYFTSAAQTDRPMPGDRTTLFQRLRRGLARLAPGQGVDDGSAQSTVPTAHRSYFLHHLFQKVVIAEAHLVRPNLRWEFRFRMLRMLGHVVSLVLFIWLVSALIVSFDNNHAYLQAISKKTDALVAQVKTFRKAPNVGGIREILTASRDLPQYQNIDLESPGGGYRYGLYTAPGVIDASEKTYQSLERQMLLPQIVRRIEAALDDAIAANDPDGAYRTLTIYLMLFDSKNYDAKAIKHWVMRDWERNDSGSAFGDRTVMAQHLDALFADGKPVAPSVARNAELVQRARTFLNSNPAPARLYERAKAAMEREAPENFTLVTAVGPQATSVFTLAGNPALDRGVPGLYTYEGYHEVFEKRLPEFLAQAQTEDAWVMGREDIAAKVTSAMQNTGLPLARGALAQDIRRQYLTDYGNYWQQFVDDIRPVSIGDDVSGSLALDLQTLRTMASPDSPLVRLARAIVKQTSLSAMDAAPADSTGLADAAANEVKRRSRAASIAASAAEKVGATRPELRMEKELVDNHFAALREVVTGMADTGNGPAPQSAPVASATKPLQLDAIIGLINEQYTRLAVADNALATSTMPPTADIGSAMKMESAKLPAPLRAILAGISDRTTQKVNQGVGSMLALQVDSSVGEVCRRAIDGKYPFAGSTQEVDIEDFNRVFAADGLLDTFFQKNLAAYVDTGTKPWRYKPLSPGMPAINGPSLLPFQQAAAIREIFFREPGAKRMAWKMDVKVVSLDPEVTELSMDIDGQGMRYAHGPVVPFSVTWPGPRGGATAEITANPRVRPETSTILANGPWALFRMMERGRAIETASASRMSVDFTLDGRHAVLELVTSGQANPLTSSLLKGFRCPRGGGA